MRTLYFDCYAGASGDMILGALVGAGCDPSNLMEKLASLGVEGYEVQFTTVNRSGLSATRADVRAPEEKKHRHLKDILGIINDSRLDEKIKGRATAIFMRLAEAESHVHNEPVEKIHFHEVGALDAIVDVVGACIGFELLGVDRFLSSALHVGSGTVQMAHGRFPVPPPAVAELLKDAPVYSSEIRGELVTPTGAAIISTVCEQYGAIPRMRITSVGYGAGFREYDNFPNALRVIIGEEDERAQDERLLMIETNVDDMSPQILGFVMERAFSLGALDCYFTSVQMKKNRPGALVSILCRPADRERLTEMLFAETTTLGVRAFEVERRALERETVAVETRFGAIDIKIARLDNLRVKAMPEFEQCRAAAERARVSLREVEEAAQAAYMKLREK
ncbi:MAG TPA: nickel pincer cofactor biosynthesis protein LarC [Pyrinomonadaceae bacterium]|nr:nickel pincer cofactor biosynthesis protein LarC [Pyrinomonadaceae bacterium]